MKRLIATSFLLVSVLSQLSFANDGQEIHHDLKVVLSPENNHLQVTDTITIADTHLPTFHFFLYKGLNPSSPTKGITIKRLFSHDASSLAEAYEVRLPQGQKTFVLQYDGEIYRELEAYGREYARGFRDTAGIISEEGIYLSGRSYWYPHLDGVTVTFSLHIVLPSQWDAVSQGARIFHRRNDAATAVAWESRESQGEIYIIGGKFTEYTRTSTRVDAMVFLRSPDETLAHKYLDATKQYIEMYERLIGPYPYSKFALVENFWETGFGMPSFTLLGPKIIRFPFILHSSYPHEILHNWWGNSVYPDYAAGNWSEGLTAYLSDHLIKEQRGAGADYRQTTLQKYIDYVRGGKDFPLSAFRSRHSSPSEAVGYGKSLMFFHMLRRELGDELFVSCLQRFYSDYKFRTASYDDMRKSFEAVSKKNLRNYFNQWTARTGAPQLEVSNVTIKAQGETYMLTAVVTQTQMTGAYELTIPIAVTLKGREEAYQTAVRMKGKHLKIALDLPGRPERLDLDPAFDLFRKLSREEIPPALSQVFGSEQLMILLPASEMDDRDKGYQTLAELLGRAGPDSIEVRYDKDLDDLPTDRSVILLGWNNSLLDTFKHALSGYDVEIDDLSVRIGSNRIQKRDHAFVFTARHPHNNDLSLALITTDDIKAIPGLGRKLPHYHKYSYLAFEGDEPSNVAKGRWPIHSSPMTVFIQDAEGAIKMTERGKLKKRKPLIALPSVFSGKRMMQTVRFLASEDLAGRGFGSDGLDRAADFIADMFRASGLVPAGDKEGSYVQTWEDVGGEPERKVAMKNIVGLIPGTHPSLTKQCVVVGAHYDHLGLGWPEAREMAKGKIHPGADDNASGVAVLTEVARTLSKDIKPDRSIVFVAFTGEESGMRGSHYFAHHNHTDYIPSECIGMINLDTVGRLQNNKLMVLGVDSAREWVHIFRGAGYVTGVTIETVSEELDSSDQISFHEVGVPAVQLFSGPHADYHRPSDNADKIDPEGLVKIALVTKEAIEYLAGRHDPLSREVKMRTQEEQGGRKKREISLGTIPDFAFKGKGCRLTGVIPDSPAEACGLKAGDIIIKINDQTIEGLRDFSSALKRLKSGDRAHITFIRGGKRASVEATVVPR